MWLPADSIEYRTRLWPKLLPRTALISTGDKDVPALNFHPLLAVVARVRFWIMLSLLPNRRFARVLEIGYGSGIFMPELAGRCDELYGVDIHPHASTVSRHLKSHGIDAALTRGSGIALPFKDQTFDCIVAMSCLEYIDPFDNAAREIKRVLRRDGCVVVVTPGTSPLIDFGHDLLTGRPVKEGYGDRRRLLAPTLAKYLRVHREMVIPRVGKGLITLYRGMKLGVSN
jgi:ubiquinone/menaquinone biosynthesis C-methylase UbiE